MHTIQYEMMWAALTPAYAKLPACLKRLRERLKSLPSENDPVAHATGSSNLALTVIPFVS
jgi:hypothetical protein